MNPDPTKPLTKILVIFGTRPEIIKLAPVITALQAYSHLQIRTCNTGQHREMAQQVLEAFSLTPDHNLDLMQAHQTLEDLTARMLTQLGQVLTIEAPDLVIVQGDTTTALSGALAAAYAKIPVAHVEAGLRSHNPTSPFPEELNRILIDQIASYHFAVTAENAENLQKEGITRPIFVVGNTVVDAVQGMCTQLLTPAGKPIRDQYQEWGKFILITCHRRESFGQPLQEICAAIDTLSLQHPDVEFIFPVHLNPEVQNGVRTHLPTRPNLRLIPPLSYPDMIWLMQQAYCILSDSGGIQEEAASLGKPVLVLRDITERPEGLATGIAKLVGRDSDSIIQHTNLLLATPTLHAAMSAAKNPYGDGKSSLKIAEELVRLI